MSEAFIGEIRMTAFAFPARGWALCNGQLLPIAQNQALFSLLGTMYGGNGQTTFALPDLRGRTPFHRGAGFTQGQLGGEEAHTLLISEIPLHLHSLQTTGGGANQAAPANAGWAGQTGKNPFAAGANTTLAPNASGIAGGSQPHQNMSPFLTVSFMIALQGIFPSRN